MASTYQPSIPPAYNPSNTGTQIMSQFGRIPQPKDTRIRPMNTGLPSLPPKPAAPSTTPAIAQPKFQPSLSQQQPATSFQPQQQSAPANNQMASAASGQLPMQIETSITPENIYSDQQTQRYLNEERDRLAVQANPSFLKKQFMRPGSRMGYGQAAQVAPQIAELQSQSAGLGAAIPFADMQANMQNYNTGLFNRDHEAQGLASVGQTGMFADQQNTLNNQNTLLRLLQGMI